MVFGRMVFGRMVFGRMVFGRMVFGRMVFGRMVFGRVLSWRGLNKKERETSRLSRSSSPLCYQSRSQWDILLFTLLDLYFMAIASILSFRSNFFFFKIVCSSCSSSLG